MTPRFKFRSTFLGASTFDVIDGSETYIVSYQFMVDDYARSIFNGTPEQFTRDVEGRLNCLSRSCGDPIDTGTVDAFNAWRMNEHVLQMVHIDANPDRYNLAANDPIRCPPRTAIGAHYENGVGWIKNAA